jgi:isopenicillin-N epimerase
VLYPGIREEFNLDFSIKHFNHGAFGAIPNTVREFQRELFAEIDANPTGFYRRKLEPSLEEARLVAARYLGADPDGFAWVRNASEGLTVAINAVRLGEDDEVVVTNQIYPSVVLALQAKTVQTGATMGVVPVGIDDSDDDILAKFECAITPRTKLIVVDEISSPTGQIMPIRRIAALARRVGAAIIVDAAHAPGMYAVNVDELQVDFWVGNFHKWVCAPHAAGCIWVDEKYRDRIRPSYVSFRDAEPFPSNFSRLGTDDQTAALCVPIAIEFLDRLGPRKVFEHNRSLAQAGGKVIAEALGTKPLQGTFGARVPIALPKKSQRADSLNARELQIKIAEEFGTELSVTEPLVQGDKRYITISAFVYNDEDEYRDFARQFARWLTNSLVAV